MLILTRRPAESVLIGDRIEVVVLSMQGNQVRIGVKAPPNMVILRSELLQYVSPPMNGKRGK
jgi:carbon storage regulator